MALSKVRVQLINETTGEVEQEVDVLTSADAVLFADGETFQEKLEAGKLTGRREPKEQREPLARKDRKGRRERQVRRGQRAKQEQHG